MDCTPTATTGASGMNLGRMSVDGILGNAGLAQASSLYE